MDIWSLPPTQRYRSQLHTMSERKDLPGVLCDNLYLLRAFAFEPDGESLSKSLNRPSNTWDSSVSLQVLEVSLNLWSNKLLSFKQTGVLLDWIINHTQNTSLSSALIGASQYTPGITLLLVDRAIEAGNMQFLRCLFADVVDYMPIIIARGDTILQRLTDSIPQAVRRSSSHRHRRLQVRHTYDPSNYGTADRQNMIRFLVENGIKINQPVSGQCRFTALHTAAYLDDVELTTFLVAAGADVDMRSFYGSTALAVAASRGHNKTTSTLIKAGADINALYFDDPDDTGYFMTHYAGYEARKGLTALTVAASRGFCNTVLLLIEAGADVNALNHNGSTALSAAVELGHLTVVETLVVAQADVEKGYIGANSVIYSPFDWSSLYSFDAYSIMRCHVVQTTSCLAFSEIVKTAESGIDDLSRCLDELGDNIRLASIQIPLVFALRRFIGGVHLQHGTTEALSGPWEEDRENYRSCKSWLSAGSTSQIFPHEEFRCALRVARKNCDIRVIQILSAKIVDVNIPGILSAAASSEGVDNIQLLELLLHRGCNLLKYGGDALRAAALAGNYVALKYLLKGGANINDPGDREIGRTPLQVASEAGELKMVQYLVLEDADINAPPCRLSGGTALQLAIRSRCPDIADFLLRAGADVNGPTSSVDGLVALHEALCVGKSFDFFKIRDHEVIPLELVGKLLDHGANVRTPRPKLKSYYVLPLLVAAVLTRNCDFIQRVIDFGVDINESMRQKDPTPIQIAINLGDLQAVKRLLHAGADVNDSPRNKHRRTALQQACEENNHDIVQLLLNAGADVNAPPEKQKRRTYVYETSGSEETSPISFDSTTALQAACLHGNGKLVRLLLEAGANVNCMTRRRVFRPGTALEAACWAKDINTIKILADWGANIDVVVKIEAWPSTGYGTNLLEAAARAGNAQLMALLFKIQADTKATVSQDYTTDLLGAACGAKTPNICVIKFLLEKGADINSTCGFELTGRRVTPLQLVAGTGNHELACLLIANGADPNVPGEVHLGRTPLQSAAEAGDLSMSKLLLDAGADINAPAAGDLGRTALQAACSSSHPNVELVQFLLAQGAEVDGPPGYNGGVTALQGAAIRGYLRIALLLIQSGANVNAPPAPIQGLTALGAAMEFKRIDMVQLLLNAGANSSLPSRSDRPMSQRRVRHSGPGLPPPPPPGSTYSQSSEPSGSETESDNELVS
jgi:ankyrin repeat protein